MPTTDEIIAKRYRELAGSLEGCVFDDAGRVTDRGETVLFCVEGEHDGLLFRLEALYIPSPKNRLPSQHVNVTRLTLLEERIHVDVAFPEKPLFGFDFFKGPGLNNVPGWSVSRDRLVIALDEDHLAALVASHGFEEAMARFDWHAVASLELVSIVGARLVFPGETSFKVSAEWLSHRLEQLREIVEAVPEVEEKPQWREYLGRLEAEKKKYSRRIGVASLIGMWVAFAAVFFLMPSADDLHHRNLQVALMTATSVTALVGAIGSAISKRIVFNKARKKLAELRRRTKG